MIEVSVIVCTYNREQYIGKALKCLRNQNTRKGTYEVIIVDNNSTDNTKSICESLASLHPEIFKYYLEKNQGLSYARNRGVEEAQADTVSFLDDDAFVNENYIESLISTFESYPEVVAIGGKIVPHYESGQTPKWISKYLFSLVAGLDMGDKIKVFPKNKFPIGANMGFRKHVFDTYGMFDVNLGRRSKELEGGEEKELFYRLHKAGEIIIYAPAISIIHVIPEKRVQKEYIKGMGIGVGTSELKRWKTGNFKFKVIKIINESIKVGGTFILSSIYFLQFRFSAAVMLIKFRYWVLKGLFSRSSMTPSILNKKSG